MLDSDHGDGTASDGGIQARILSLDGRIGRHYAIPKTFPNNGLILRPAKLVDQDRLPILGIWLMPGNVRDGIFEDLLLDAMPIASRDYVSNVVDRAKADGMAGFRDVERSKAIVKTHIAWQDPNKKNVGEALAAHFEEIKPAFGPFVAWVQRLFGDGDAAD